MTKSPWDKVANDRVWEIEQRKKLLEICHVFLKTKVRSPKVMVTSSYVYKNENENLIPKELSFRQ